MDGWSLAMHCGTVWTVAAVFRSYPGKLIKGWIDYRLARRAAERALPAYELSRGHVYSAEYEERLAVYREQVAQAKKAARPPVPIKVAAPEAPAKPESISADQAAAHEAFLKGAPSRPLLLDALDYFLRCPLCQHFEVALLLDWRTALITTCLTTLGNGLITRIITAENLFPAIKDAKGLPVAPSCPGGNCGK